MPETIQRDYYSISDMDQEEATVSGNKFFVHSAGKTNGAHLTIVTKLKGIGQIEVNSPEESDYLLVFCPIASRVGTDVGDALENMPGGKPAILVVMHHTFDRHHVVAESRRLVDNTNVRLTVDYLFYEGNLLNCNRNDIAWSDIQKSLGVPPSPVSTWNDVSNWVRDHWKLVAFVCVCVAVGVVIIVTVTVEEQKK